MSDPFSSSLQWTAEAWWLWIWPMTWQVAVLVFVLSLLSLLLRRRSARLRYALWLLVPIRLILPPTLALACSWGWWVLPSADTAPRQTTNPTVVATRASDVSPKHNPGRLDADTSEAAAPSSSDDHFLPPTVVETRVLKEEQNEMMLPPVETKTTSHAESAPAVTGPASMSWRSYLFIAWLLGIAALATRLVCGAIFANKMVGRSTPCDVDIVDLAEQCRRRIGLRREVAVRRLADVTVPMLVGLVRPTIILPQGIEQRLTKDELEAVLIHEMQHVARCDPAVHLMQTLLGIVYFFHPFVWLANRMLRRLREDACDEATLAVLAGERRHYGAGIVKVAELAAGRTPTMALGVVESGRQVERRLTRILDPRLPLGRRLSWPALVLLVMIAAVLLPAAARPGKSAPAEGKQSSESDVKQNAKQVAEQAANLVTLRGIVVDENDAPLAGAIVYVEWRRGGKAETRSGAGGQFELKAPRDEIRGHLVRAAIAAGKRQAQQPLPFDEKNDFSQEIHLQLRPAQRVELHVVNGNGKPIAGALAAVRGGYQKLADGKTDKAGHVRFFVPHDVHIECVFAMAAGYGLDYQAYMLPRGRQEDQNAKAPELPAGPIRLTLDGVKPLVVSVVDADSRPLAGIRLYPWLLKKPEQTVGLNLSYFGDAIQATTDEAGHARFDWIPHWNERTITVWPQAEGYVHQRGMYDPKTGDGTLTLRLDRLVPVSGRVTLLDGSPAAGISIAAIGASYQFDGFRGSAETDADGSYQIKAAPNMVYLIVVQDDHWAAAPHTGFAVWPAKPIDDLDFQLRPATRLFGRVTLSDDQKPVAGQRVAVTQYGQDAHNLKDVELPNPQQSNRWVQPNGYLSTSTDEQGNFELFVGPGKFMISGPEQTDYENFEITDEKQKEFHFHAARPEEGALRGLVVAGDSAKPVAEAEIVGIYRHPRAAGDLHAAADSAGKFEVTRKLHRTVIHARSKDGKLAGVVQIGPDDEMVTIPIRTMATATARLIDGATGQPMPGEEIRYGVEIPIGDDDAPWRTSFGGTTNTDAAGRFSLDGLIIGQNYAISVTVRRGSDGRGQSWSSVGEITPANDEPIALGDLKLKPRPRPQTIDERISAAFKVKGTLAERFAAATRDAALSRQHIFVLFANPAGKAAQQLMRLRYEDAEVRNALDPFRVLAVDSSAGNFAAARNLAGKFTDDFDGSRAALSVYVTDKAGKLVASADAAALMSGDRIDKAKLLALLEKQTLKPLDARQLLDDALARARQENKRVIAQETATWCGPCKLLSRFLDKHRRYWEKDYIWVKMDHRWHRAREIMKELRGEADAGVPWWVILDADGKPLATSNNSQGDNIGFPNGDDGRAHFRSMLEKTRIRLTDAEITALVDALQEDAP